MKKISLILLILPIVTFSQKVNKKRVDGDTHTIIVQGTTRQGIDTGNIGFSISPASSSNTPIGKNIKWTEDTNYHWKRIDYMVEDNDMRPFNRIDTLPIYMLVTTDSTWDDMDSMMIYEPMMFVLSGWVAVPSLYYQRAMTSSTGDKSWEPIYLDIDKTKLDEDKYMVWITRKRPWPIKN